jgi:hypothetical protein
MDDHALRIDPTSRRGRKLIDATFRAIAKWRPACEWGCRLPASLSALGDFACSVTEGAMAPTPPITSSGDMDWFGTKKCLARLYSRRPWMCISGGLARDGDATRNHPIQTLQPSALLTAVREHHMWDGTCYTHALKNCFKWADKVLPKEECKCAKKSTKNHRFTAPVPSHMHAWICHLLGQAELMYLPEKTEGYCAPGAYPVSVMDEARASRRDAAIEYFGMELDVMLDHFLGNHTRCSHKPITNGQVFSCSAQVGALTQYLGTLKDKAPMLLSPIGIVHA